MISFKTTPELFWPSADFSICLLILFPPFSRECLRPWAPWSGGQQQVDQSVENADKHQQDYDHHGDEGRSLAVFCLVKERVDLAGDQIPAGRDQEDDGADGSDGLHEGVHQAGEEGVAQHRQGDPAEGVAAAGTQNGGGLFNGVVDLQQRGGAGLNRHRHIPEHEHDHQDGSGAGEHQEAGVEGQDVGDAQHGAGDGEHQNRGQFNEPLAVVVAHWQ